MPSGSSSSSRSTPARAIPASTKPTQSASLSGATTGSDLRPKPKDGFASRIRRAGDRLEQLSESGFRIDGGRCLGAKWWCMIQAPDGTVVMDHGWTPTHSARSAVDKMRVHGWHIDADSSDAITEGLRHQVYGQ